MKKKTTANRRLTKRNPKDSALNAAREERRKALALELAFYEAGAIGNVQIAENLLEAGVDIRSCYDVLEAATENNQIEMLKFLVPKFDRVRGVERAMLCAAEDAPLEAARAALTRVEHRKDPASSRASARAKGPKS